MPEIIRVIVYVIHTVRIFTVNIPSKNTHRDKPFMTYINAYIFGTKAHCTLHGLRGRDIFRSFGIETDGMFVFVLHM
jgi:hypothetical protein